ncbi:hypothetical protein [Streptomyces sp. NPDC007063]|uniref:hypothetical protein n=1 Tax=Streptomyces sp. NPDC007063 TaxID=3364772 RepID=UPI00369ACF85
MANPRTLTLGRWVIEWHQRALYITRQPDPNCTKCGGDQANWWFDGPDWEPCTCIDQLRVWRIPLTPWRHRETEEVPF